MSSKTYEVLTEDRGDPVHIRGDSFHVDDKGNLYIRTFKETDQTGSFEHVAVFVSGYWLAIQVDPDER